MQNSFSAKDDAIKQITSIEVREVAYLLSAIDCFVIDRWIVQCLLYVGVHNVQHHCMRVVLFIP